MYHKGGTMKSLALTILLVSCCFAIGEWESIGPYGANLLAMGVAPTNDDIIYAAGDGWTPPIYKSIDGGNSWLKIGNIPDWIYWVKTLVVDPADPDIVYIAVERLWSDFKLYKSTDGGKTWIGDIITDQCTGIGDLAVHTNLPSTVFAAGGLRIGSERYSGFFKTTDGGETWTETRVGTVGGCIALDPSDPDLIYIGGGQYVSSSARLYKSTDGGASFADISSDLSDCASIDGIAVHPTNSNIVYAGVWSEGIYRSTDSGASWSLVHPHPYISCIAASVAGPDITYAASYNIVYKSTDAGVSWFETGSGIHGEEWTGDLYVRNDDATTVYAANYAGFYKTTNGGMNWFECSDGMPALPIVGLGVAPSAPTVIYTSANAYCGDYKTNSSGADWIRFDSDNGGSFSAFAVHNTNPSVVFATVDYTCGDKMLMKSTDGGLNWDVNDTCYYYYGDITADPNNDAVFWSGGNYNNGSDYVMAVSKTTDGGATWMRYELTSTFGVAYALAVDPKNSDIVYAGGRVGYNSGLYKTTNSGETWSDISLNLTGYVNDLAINPYNTNIVYAGTCDGVYKSFDGGEHWMNTGLSYVRAVLIDPQSPHNIIIAGTATGVYVSLMGGGNWEALNEGLANTDVKCLALHPEVYLFTGTYGGGLYRFDYSMIRRRLKGAMAAQEQESKQYIVFAQPNPMRSKTIVHYVLGQKTPVKFSIYNVQGRLIRTLVNEVKNAGTHAVVWNGLDKGGKPVSSGIYFCRLSTDTKEGMKKLIVVR